MFPYARAFFAAFALVAMFNNSACAGGFQFDELWKRAKDDFSSRFYKATANVKPIISASNPRIDASSVGTLPVP